MGLRPGRSLTLVAVLGTFALSAGLGSLWHESSATCALAGVLLEDIRSLMVDGHVVVSDPFLEYAMASEDSFLPRIGLERELAQRILARFGRFHLSLGFLMDLGKLPELESTSLQAYLKDLESWRQTLHPAPQAAEDLLSGLPASPVPEGPGRTTPEAPSRTAPQAPGAPPEAWYSNPALARAKLRGLAELDHQRLEEARERVPALKAEWTADTQVYCRSMLSLRRMAMVQDTQRQGCESAVARRKPSCGRAATLRFQAEVDQLEKVRSLNEKKLKLKWGRRLYAEIHCD